MNIIHLIKKNNIKKIKNIYINDTFYKVVRKVY